jgi:hypothetical protein
MALDQNDLLALIANELPDNTTKQNSSSDVRTVLSELVDSAYNVIDDVLTQVEYQAKNAEKIVTSANIALDYRVQKFKIENDSGTVSNAIAAGGALNLNSLLLNANEYSLGVVPAYRNALDAAQATFNDEANDKFLFPSNLNTFNNGYVPYHLRVTLTVDHGALTTVPIVMTVAIKREVDDSLVTGFAINMHDEPIRVGELAVFDLTTYVGGESDPYVVDGCYLELSSGASSPEFTLTDANIVIFKT